MDNEFTRNNSSQSENNSGENKDGLERSESKIFAEQGHFFSFEGVCSLKKFWIHFLIFIFFVVIDCCYSYIYAYTPFWGDLIEKIVYMFIFVVWIVHMLCLGVQRFRSVGQNPWKILIPVYGALVIEFVPELKDHTNNKYLYYEIPGEKWLRIIFVLYAGYFSKPVLLQAFQILEGNV